MPTRTAKKTKSQGVVKILPTVKNEKKQQENTNGKSVITAVMIPLDKITPSPLPSQERRRRRFDAAKLEELAESVRRHGVVNPITVRETGKDRFEIVAGERRFRASEVAGKIDIPAVIKNLTDTEAAEIQLVENGQRQDQHPLDEAFDYLDMKTVLGFAEEEIALRIGKPVAYVANRLKLKDLGNRARAAFEQNLIGLTHALEIAKYPAEAHDELFELSQNDFGYASQSLLPLSKFIERIRQHYLLQLKKAPFSVKSTELRKDGLACTACPERTGANPLLFEENYSDKDSCMNRACWKAKTLAHIQIQRRRIVETDSGITEPEKLEKAAGKVPLITKDYYVRDDEKPGEAYLKNDEFKMLSKQEDCEFSERGVFFHGDRIGQKAWICRNKKCKTHFGSYSVANPAAADPEAQREARLIRKEEIFNSRVAESARRRVLRKVAEKFDAENTIYTHKNAEGFQMELLTRLWKLQCSYSDHTAKVICEILELDKSTLSVERWGSDPREQILNLSPDIRSRLLFLLLVAHECEIFEAYWSYQSQKPIEELATDFGVDYQLIDAEERLGQIPMKLKATFRNYLEEVEKGNRKAKPPAAYSDKWKQKK